MRCVSAILGLALAAAASASPVVRQGTTQATDIGTQGYELIASSVNSNCPKNFSHGTVNRNPGFQKYRKFGVEGYYNFSEIKQSRTPCQGTLSNASMVLLSQSELDRASQTAANFLRLNKTAWRKVFLAGIDTEPRKCGNFQASNEAYYAFTKEIEAFMDRLRDLSVSVPERYRASGDRWMISYIPQSSAICAYIDENTKTYRTINNITTSLSSTPQPSNGATTTTTTTPTDPFSTTSETMEPSPTADGGNSGSVCFPASATVELEDGSVKTMDNVELGDKVKVSEGVYSDVFMFTHKMADVGHDFVVLKTTSGVELALTHGHYLYVNGVLASAKTVRIGDAVESASGELLTVSSVSVKAMKGLYNPQTIHGDVIVDGIRASTFTTAVHPCAAQALLAPIRGLYAKLGFVTAFLDQGSDFLANQMPSGAAVVA